MGNYSMSELLLVSESFAEKFLSKRLMANEKSNEFWSKNPCQNMSRRIILAGDVSREFTKNYLSSNFCFD